MSCFAGPNVLNDGLVLYLDAANSKSYPGSGDNWYDLSESGNHGTLTNDPVFNINNSGVFTFDNTDKYINGQIQIPPVGTNVTLEAICKLNTINTIKNLFMIGRGGSYFSCGLTVLNSNLRFRNSFGDHSFSSPSTLTTDVWYHLVISITDSISNGYVNTISQGTTNNVVAFNTITDFYIGRRSSNSATEFMNGDLSLIRVYYNKAFTSEEVKQNFNALRGRFGL